MQGLALPNLSDESNRGDCRRGGQGCASAPGFLLRHSRAGGNPGIVALAKQFCVYILASQRNGTLYTGVTSDLIRRTWQHKQGVVEGFTMKYHVKSLVYFEVHDSAHSAIEREKQIKKWRRAWKLRLIEESNPDWNDLYGLITS
jgi:putative endonuclease